MTDVFVCERPTREPWLTAWENLPDLRYELDETLVGRIVASELTRSGYACWLRGVTRREPR